MIKNGGAQPFIDSATKVVPLIIYFVKLFFPFIHEYHKFLFIFGRGNYLRWGWPATRHLAFMLTVSSEEVYQDASY